MDQREEKDQITAEEEGGPKELGLFVEDLGTLKMERGRDDGPEAPKRQEIKVCRELKGWVDTGEIKECPFL